MATTRTRSKLISAEQAAALIGNGAVVSISSSSGLGCPDDVLRAVGERYSATGEPRGITTLHPIAAGDMYGIPGIDHLAKPGLLRRVIAGSYPSGPSSMPSPRIWQMIHEHQVEAYNLPSGVLFQLHRETAAGCPGVLTQVGIDTFIDPRRLGGRMNDISTEELVHLVQFDGREWLYIRAIPIDIAIIRGTTADESGNITMEHEGAFLGVLDQALAAHNSGGIVIAQVKRIAATGSLPPQRVRVPGVLVDYLVLACGQMQTTQTPYEPAISGGVVTPLESIPHVEWGADKVIARRAAMELHTGDAANLGFGISALVPRILMEEGLHGAVTWVIEQGAVGGVPLWGFQFGCAMNPQAIVPSPDQFTYFQGGGMDLCLLSFLQVDREGNVNVSRLSSKPHVTAGVGGFIDITARARHIVLSGYFTAGGLRLSASGGRMGIEAEGQVKKIVSQVDHVTFSGRRARQLGQKVTIVTERCVISLVEDGLVVTEIAPGVSLEKDVLQQAEFPLRVSDDLAAMDPRLFRPEPVGLVLGEPSGRSR